MNHPSTETLSTLLDGEIEREEAFTVEAHLRACPDCRDALEGLRRTARLLQGLERLPAPEGLVDEVRETIRRHAVGREVPAWGRPAARLPLLRSPWLPVAASVLLVVVVSLLVVQLGLLEQRQPVAQEARLEQPAEEPVPRRAGDTAAQEDLLQPERREETARKGAARQEQAEPSAPKRLAAPPPVPAPEEADDDLPPEDRLALEDRVVERDFERGRAGKAERAEQEAREARAQETAGPAGEAEPLPVVFSVRSAGGEMLGDLEIRFLPPGTEKLPPGIQILCEPSRGEGYGSRQRPVAPEAVPAGFTWPVPTARSPISWRVPAGGMNPPGATLQMDGRVLVDREGGVQPRRLPSWVSGPLEDLDMRPARCPNGMTAAAEMPFSARWVPTNG